VLVTDALAIEKRNFGHVQSPGGQIAMATKTKIEWTDTTWNPVRGCTKVSPGCTHCYAETFAERFRGVKGHPYEKGFDLRLVPEKLMEPFSWTEPSMVFVNSMSDLFHPDVPDDFIVRVAQVMTNANWHTYQVLTKRSERLRDMLNGILRFATASHHIWWGVSVEDVKYGKPRIDHLRNTCASVKFLSIEPLLEDIGSIDLSEIDWVIVGGESGLGARPMKELWVTKLLQQCQQASVPFFFKQWGGVQKKKHGRILNGQTYDEFPLPTNTIIPDRNHRRLMAGLLEQNFIKSW
jgi:protein gp37